MLARQSVITKYPGLIEGTTVYCNDGEKLGKITMLADDYFVVEKGLFFPRDFTIRYDDINEFRGNDLYLKLNKSDLEEWKNESYTGWNQMDEINAGRLSPQVRPEYKDHYGKFFSEETKVPVMEEKLEAQKHMREAGEVTLKKIVHTELKHFTVPVMKEEVRVERASVKEGEAATATQERGAFQESTVRVPVMEEEVTVSKRPVVKEEIRVSKERRTEEAPISGEVKKEEVEIKEHGDIKKKAG